MNIFRQKSFSVKKLLREEKGAISEFLGFILFLIIVLGLLIPLSLELFIYNNQAQELDRLTKIAAKRACSLMPLSSLGVAADINQGSLGVGTDVLIMQPLVNAVFRNEAAHPDSYFDNTPDGQNIDLKILDFLGNPIDQSERVGITDTQGTSDQVLMVGSNTDAGLCPAGGGSNWKYCMDKSGDGAGKQALMSTGRGENRDLVARMEMFQPGRCGAGKDCSQDFSGRIDRCTVCATKSRESIFAKSVFLRRVLFLDCSKSGNVTLLPCTMTACATSRYVQYSGKRGYAPHYRDIMNLGQTYQALEGNPNVASKELSDGEPDPNTFCLMLKDVHKSGMFKNLIGSDACSQVSPSIPSSGLPTSGIPSSGLPTSGLPTSGLPSSGLPTSGLPTSGLPTSGFPTSGIPSTSGGGSTNTSSSGGTPSSGVIVSSGGGGSGSTIGDEGWGKFDQPGFTCPNDKSLEDKICQAATLRDKELNEAKQEYAIALDKLVIKYSNSLGSPAHIAEIKEEKAKNAKAIETIKQEYEDTVAKLTAESNSTESGQAQGSQTGNELGTNIGGNLDSLAGSSGSSSSSGSN